MTPWFKKLPKPGADLFRFDRNFSEAAIWEAWNYARQRVGHKFSLYECRHASASELYRKLKGDLIRLKEVGGWTTLERYVTDRSDNRDLF